MSGHDNWGGYEEQETAGDTGEAQFDLSAGAHALTSIASPSANFAYDSNGNMVSAGLKLFEYNEANQLKRVKLASNSATLAEYMYDFNGKRMVKKNYVNGSLHNTVYSWSDSFETKVIEGGATETSVYYFANKELVAKKKNDGSIQYVHTDHLGSTSVITNQAGSLVESTSYDPWGEVLAGGTVSKFGYTGQEKDSETGLNYYDSRYYSSDIRRFAQPDSLIPNIYNPQDLNRYSYANNNPLKYTDPTGHVGEILKYNQALNQYYKKPSAITYNNVLNTAASIQKQSGNTTNSSGSNNSGSRNGGNSSSPKNDNSGARDVIKQAFNSNPVSRYFFGNDINTLTSSYSTFGDKGWAIVGLASNFGGSGGRGAVTGLKTFKEATHNISGGEATAKTILNSAEEWLGSGYKEIDNGVFRSADGSRQFRMTTSDLIDPKQGPHASMEAIAPDGRHIIENSHVKILDP